MGIKTYSAFIYGHTINETNRFFDFDEGAGELTAEIEIGSYSLNDFIAAVSTAINKKGTQEYTINLDRTERKITISAPGTFTLLPETGQNKDLSSYPLMGYELDTLSAISHLADNASGSYFEPQNILQKYVDFENNVKTINSVSRTTATGRVEVVSYGTVKFMMCNITPITDISPQISIKSNPNAVSDFRTFMSYCITKAPIEFIADIDAPDLFVKALLDSTAESKDGVDFKIKELFGRKLFGYYQSGNLTFRGL